MPSNWLNRLIGTKIEDNIPGQNHLDSLFGLPLFPPSIGRSHDVSAIAQRLTKKIDRKIHAFSVEKAQKQLTSVSEEQQAATCNRWFASSRL